MEPKYGTKVEPEPQHSLTNKPRTLISQNVTSTLQMLQT